MDYNYSYLSFGGYIAGQAMLEGFYEHVAKLNKDESPYRSAFAQVIVVADTDQEAEELYAEHILYFFNRCLHVYPGFSDPPGYLRDLWPDWKGDDRWRCKPYGARVRPEESFPGGERDAPAHAPRKY